MKKFDQYVSHLRILSRAFDEDLTNDFIVSGIIDKYYIQFELGWKVLKELLRYEGANQAATGSPREIIKTAYAYYDFIDESVWLGMLRDRNDTTHIYNEEAARQLALPVENIDLYYVDPSDSDFAKLGLNYTVKGETNLIGVHVDGDYSRATGDMYAIMGMKLWAEYLDGIAVATVSVAGAG